MPDSDKRVTARAGLIHSTRLHLVLYSALLVATPFLMLRAYLQDAIGRVSLAEIPIAGLSVPVVPLVAAGCVGALLAAFRPPRSLAAASPPLSSAWRSSASPSR